MNIEIVRRIVKIRHFKEPLTTEQEKEICLLTWIDKVCREIAQAACEGKDEVQYPPIIHHSLYNKPVREWLESQGYRLVSDQSRDIRRCNKTFIQW